MALTWTDPGDASITRYQVRRRAVEGNLTAIAGNAEVALSWRNPHGPAIPDYQYRYRAGAGDWTGWTALRGLTSTSHTVTGLTNDAKHTFEVRRYFSGDHLSTPSPLVALKTVGRYGYGVLDSENKVTLTWSTPSDTSGISGWQQRSRIGAGAWTSWADVPSSTATTASWRTDALTTGTAYTYEVRPVRSGQTTATDRWEFTAVAAGSVTMTWADPADDYIVGYEVKRDVRTGSSTQRGQWAAMPGSGGSTTSFTAGGLASGTFHTFNVRAMMRRQLDTATATPSASEGWTDITHELVASPASLTFTTLNWNTAQTATLKLAAKPASDVRVTLAQAGVEFTESKFTFTTTNWNITQNVSVKLTAAPQAERRRSVSPPGAGRTRRRST